MTPDQILGQPPVLLSRSQKDLEKFIADFEKDKKKGDLPADLVPKL